jgi:hypothetical protein
MKKRRQMIVCLRHQHWRGFHSWCFPPGFLCDPVHVEEAKRRKVILKRLKRQDEEEGEEEEEKEERPLKTLLPRQECGENRGADERGQKLLVRELHHLKLSQGPLESATWVIRLEQSKKSRRIQVLLRNCWHYLVLQSRRHAKNRAYQTVPRQLMYQMLSTMYFLHALFHLRQRMRKEFAVRRQTSKRPGLQQRRQLRLLLKQERKLK